MKVVVAPDKFKGTLSAPEVARAIAEGVAEVLPDAKLTLLPLADGGEGTLEVILAARGGERRILRVHGAAGTPVDAAWGVLHDARGDTAVLEAAQVVGFGTAGGCDVAGRGSQGLGELMRHCLDQGLLRFLIGLGGTSTNDGGAGLLEALGVALRDAAGRPIPPGPAGLANLASVDFAGLDPRLGDASITLLTDVDNVLCGPSGATFTYGPQKGVRDADLAVFDAWLARLARFGDGWRGQALSLAPGSGAAGGLGYALMLLGAVRRPGAEAVCELAGLDGALADANWAITGEGRSDAQTLHGKLPWVVRAHADRARVPVTLLSGEIDAALRGRLEAGFSGGCYALVDGPVTRAQALGETVRWLRVRAAEAARARLRILGRVLR